jgi:hypothetical protein
MNLNASLATIAVRPRLVSECERTQEATMARKPEIARMHIVDRRSFLKLTGLGVAAAGLGPLLTACQPKAAPTSVVGGQVDFLSWEGYDLPTCMKEWQDAHNVTLSASYIGDHSEIRQN